jgi:hypothetical protein
MKRNEIRALIAKYQRELEEIIKQIDVYERDRKCASYFYTKKSQIKVFISDLEGLL